MTDDFTSQVEARIQRTAQINKDRAEQSKNHRRPLTAPLVPGRATAEETVDMIARTLHAMALGPPEQLLYDPASWDDLSPLARQLHTSNATRLIAMLDDLRSGALLYPHRPDTNTPST